MFKFRGLRFKCSGLGVRVCLLVYVQGFVSAGSRRLASRGRFRKATKVYSHPRHTTIESGHFNRPLQPVARLEAALKRSAGESH